MHKAEKIYLYFRVYQHHLINNNLPDDSDTITVDDLVEYVEKEISDEDRKELIEFCKEAY